MKKGFAIALALALLLTAGCSPKPEQPPETTPPETTVPETTIPETTVPETTLPMPKLETGTVQGENIPAVLCLLNRGDSVEVTGYADNTHLTVKTALGVGTMETQLLHFAGEKTPESWVGYALWNTGLYGSYQMLGAPLATLNTNTRLEVLEELEDCCLVTVDGKTGFVAKTQVSKWPVSAGGDSGGSSGGGSSAGKDGGDITLASFGGRLRLLSAVTETGSAQVRVDGAQVVLTYFQPGDTVQILAQEGFAPGLPGYLTILVEDTYAYIPEEWVQKDGEVFEPWEGFAGYSCRLYDNPLLKGQPLRQVYANTPVTVLWTAGAVSVIRVGDTIGYAATDTLSATQLPTGGTTTDSGSSGGGGSAWTPPAL